jgi:hypothetical protein
MKHFLVIAALLFTSVPSGAMESRFAIVLSMHESETLDFFGASAAWAVDSTIVDVAVQNGNVTIFARAAGRTKVIVISAATQSVLDVTVKPSAGLTTTQKRVGADHGIAEVRYSSAAREVQTSVTLTREAKDRRTEVHARTVHHAGGPVGDRAKTSVPSASIRLFRRGRELTILDRDVDHSPLTLSHTPVRGVHYLDDHWRLHAGYTAYAAYGSFLVPVEREFIAGAGYALRTSARSSITPSVFAYRGEGAVASLLYDYAEEERLQLRTELAYSNGLGGAAQLWYLSGRDRARADIRYRPDDFAVAGAGNPRGLLADGSWSREYGRRSMASLILAASDVASTRVRAASIDVEHRLSERFALTGGTSWGRFGSHETLTVPAGAQFDFSHGGIGALYRYAESATNEGGHGFRITGRASHGRLYASAYVDRQQNAPTLEIIYSELPDLALALEQLGITATTPADIARALRENAALIELGYIEGVTVDLAPLRTQLGLELAWLGDADTRQQLRARVIRSVTESVARRSATTIATISYSRRLTQATDFYAAYTYWRTERRGERSRTQPYLELGVRRQFDALPTFGGGGRITGAVFVDENLDGRGDGTPVIAEVDLDGLERKRTGIDGAFVFTGVGRGVHRVTVHIPDRPEVYFTTPSRVEAEAGDHVAFGVACTPARLLGRVTNDAGIGIAGVRVLLVRGPKQIDAETKSDGSFALAAAPGEWQLSILTSSVPAGHSLAGTEARTIMLDREQPLRTDLVLQAHRAISGTGASANAEIEVQPSGKRIGVDAEGRFSLRSLPPGEVTILANGVAHRVVVPTGPATIALDVAPKRAP